MIDTPVWDTGEWPGLAPLDTHIEAGVCVVGLGGSGLAAVEEAL
ncbi:MAG: FAD-binding oxidoreductase, partial [Acidobacteria bacterium]